MNAAYYGEGRRIELDVSTANAARLDFHSFDTSKTTAITSGGGTLTYLGTLHMLNGPLKLVLSW